MLTRGKYMQLTVVWRSDAGRCSKTKNTFPPKTDREYNSAWNKRSVEPSPFITSLSVKHHLA